MIVKTFKLTIATDTEEQMQKEKEYLSMTYGAEEQESGRWIFHEPFDNGNCNECIECSQCHIWLGHDCYAKTPYCPNCGAKMEGLKNDKAESESKE